MVLFNHRNGLKRMLVENIVQLSDVDFGYVYFKIYLPNRFHKPRCLSDVEHNPIKEDLLLVNHTLMVDED